MEMEYGDRRLLDVPALSRYISMPKATIYTMVSLRKMPGVVRLGRKLCFERRVIDEWISAQSASQSTVQGCR